MGIECVARRRLTAAARAAVVGLAAVTGGAVLGGAGCALEEIDSLGQAVIGGESSDPGEYPATGALVRGRSFRCTATLIAPDVAITAGHCLEGEGFGSFAFTLDPDLTDEMDNLIPVVAFHRHPEFREHGRGKEFMSIAKRNDVGVIILEREIDDVPFEELDGDSDVAELRVGAQLTLCGYGQADSTDRATAGVKRDAVVQLDLAADWEMQSMETDPQPCMGDSGGPLFIETSGGRRITGLVSRALGSSPLCDSGAIYTRTAPYADWIAQASHDRDEGCSAGGSRGGTWIAVVALLFFVRRRRST